MKKIIAFIQNNFISCVCLFLAATIFTGSLTLAKYISTETSNVGSSAGSFHCSGSVDDVSSLSFANLDFWGGSEKDTPMNAIHSLNFLVNNYEKRTVGESVTKHVSVAKMGYTLMFSAPAIFLEKLAMQLFESPDRVMTPQIVLADLLATANNGKFKTKDSTDYNGTAYSMDYNGVEYTDFEFSVNSSELTLVEEVKDAEGNVIQKGVKANAYTATAALPDGTVNMVLKIDPFMQNMTQTLKFRLWDVSKLTSNTTPTIDHEGGDLIAPLYADVQADVLCYRISISMPQFTLAAGVEEQDRYSLRFVTTSAVNDPGLGGFLTDNDKGDTLKSVFKNKTAYFKTMTETVTDKDSSGNVTERNTYYVIGNPRAYNPGVETSEPKVTTEYGGTYEKTQTTTGNTTGTSTFLFNANGEVVNSESSATYKIIINNAPYTQTKTSTYNVDYTTTTETETITTEKSTTEMTETINQTIKIETKKTIKTLDGTSTTEISYKLSEFPEEGVTYQQKSSWGFWYNSNKDTLSAVIKKEWKGETKVNNSEPAITVTENLPDVTYTREIVRVTSYAESITFKRVYRRVEDAEGKVTLTEYANKDNAFELFDGVIQKYFLSQCYSKSYPFKVNVYFEQLQS